MRRSEMGVWEGIRAVDVYAVYRVSPQVYSDITYSSGEYAIVFLVDNVQHYLTVQVAHGKIVRIDNNIGNPADIDLEHVASEIILAPQQ